MPYSETKSCPLVEGNTGGTVQTRGQHTPFDAADAGVLLERFGSLIHDVGLRERGVVGVHPQHAVGCGVGNVENARVFVQNHVAGNAHQVVDLNVGVTLNDAVGVVVLAGVVVGLEVVSNQFTVVAVVVPVNVVDVVSDADAVR